MIISSLSLFGVKHTPVVLCLLIGWCFGLVACQNNDLVCHDPLGCIEIEKNEPVTLVALLALSGDAAFLGEEAQGGIELALADQGGSILDHPLELLTADSACQAANAGAALTALLADAPDTVGIIGPICTAVAATILPDVSQAGLALISPANTAVSLTIPTAERGLWQPGYYRTAPSDAQQAQAAANFAAQFLDADTAAIIFADTDYGQGLAAAFVQAFREAGGTVLYRGGIAAGATEASTLLAEALIGTPDVLYLPVLEPEGNLIANAFSRLTGVNNTTLLGATTLFVPDFPVSVSSSAVDNMYLAGPALPGARVEALLAEWQDRYGEPPKSPVYAQAYDAARLLLTAVEMVAENSSNGTLLIGRQALRDALTQTVVFPGVTGDLTCSTYGDCAAETAVGIYRLSTAQIEGESWPPELVWMPGG